MASLAEKIKLFEMLSAGESLVHLPLFCTKHIFSCTAGKFCLPFSCFLIYCCMYRIFSNGLSTFYTSYMLLLFKYVVNFPACLACCEHFLPPLTRKKKHFLPLGIINGCWYGQYKCIAVVITVGQRG